MPTKLTAAAALATAAILAGVAAAGSVAASDTGVVANAQSHRLGALPPRAGYVRAFAFDPRNPNIVYVATVSAPYDTTRSHVYKTTDGGGHWHATATRGSGWTGDVVSLAADPQHPGTLYAGTNVAVYKTVDGGHRWWPWSRGLFRPSTGWFGPAPPGTPQFNRGNGWVTDIAIDPRHGNIVYAAAGGIRKSTDGGHSWKSVFLPHKWGGVGGLAIAPTRPEAIYAIVSDPTGLTSIYKSTDAGKTWHATGVDPVVNHDGYGNALVVDPKRPATLYAAIGRTVVMTTDAGTSWQPITDGLPGQVVTALAVDPQRSGTIYAGLAPGVIYKTGGVYKSTGGIYKTTNGGDSWTRAVSGVTIDALAVDPARPTTIYAAGWARWDKTHADEFRILRSSDGGNTWAFAGMG